MAFYRNRNWVKRDYEVTNIVAVECDAPPVVGWNGQPADYWEPVARRDLPPRLDDIGGFAGMKFYGYL